MTAAQLTACRENAQLSTGPRTVEGKKRSSLNAFRHGLTGQIVIHTPEDWRWSNSRKPRAETTTLPTISRPNRSLSASFFQGPPSSVKLSTSTASPAPCAPHERVVEGGLQPRSGASAFRAVGPGKMVAQAL